MVVLILQEIDSISLKSVYCAPVRKYLMHSNSNPSPGRLLHVSPMRQVCKLWSRQMASSALAGLAGPATSHQPKYYVIFVKLITYSGDFTKSI